MQGRSGSCCADTCCSGRAGRGPQPLRGGMAGAWEETEDAQIFLMPVIVMEIGELAIDFIRVWFKPGIRFVMI